MRLNVLTTVCERKRLTADYSVKQPDALCIKSELCPVFLPKWSNGCRLHGRMP